MRNDIIVSSDNNSENEFTILLRALLGAGQALNNPLSILMDRKLEI